MTSILWCSLYIGLYCSF